MHRAVLEAEIARNVAEIKRPGTAIRDAHDLPRPQPMLRRQPQVAPPGPRSDDNAWSREPRPQTDRGSTRRAADCSGESVRFSAAAGHDERAPLPRGASPVLTTASFEANRTVIRPGNRPPVPRPPAPSRTWTRRSGARRRASA